MMIDVKLDDYINETKIKDFQWGLLDCALFAADWCERKVGVNPAEGSYDAYNTEEGAYAHLKEKYGTLRKAYDKHFERVDAAFRQKGDVALCKLDGAQTVGIAGAQGFIFFKTIDKGIKAVRNPNILCVWRVE